MNTWDWNTIYLVSFGVGLVMSLLAFAGGFHALHLHLGSLRMHGHLHAPRAGRGGLSPLNGFTLMAFLCWFGGTGYLLHRANIFGVVAVLLFSALSGLAGAGLIFWFLAGVLLRHERTLEPEDTELTGVIGHLSAAIPVGGCGEMLYAQNGARRSVPVRAEQGVAIPRGAEVVVMRHRRGVAYVRAWDELERGLIAEEPHTEVKD